MEVYIITGASKGIGLSLSKILAEKGHQVFGIARSFPTNWPGTKSFEFDLVDTFKIPELLQNIFELLSTDCKSITVINNAGTIVPIGFAENNSSSDITKSITLNLTAPMVMTSAFISQAAELSVVKRILNISSGAGRNIYEGWSAYCASKSGLDHFSSCVDEEYKEIKVMSLAPGIIDTDMQQKIRQSSETDFPLLNKFRAYKEQGLLNTPEETADKIIRLLERTDFEDLNTIADIRDFD